MVVASAETGGSGGNFATSEELRTPRVTNFPLRGRKVASSDRSTADVTKFPGWTLRIKRSLV
jgi:hypothetical protein